MCIMDAFDICILNHYYYSTDDFTDLGNTILFLLSIAGAIGIGMLCHKGIRRWIRRDRTGRASAPTA